MKPQLMIFASIWIFPLAVSIPLCRTRERADLAAPPTKEPLSASRRDASGDLVEGRIGNLVGANLRCSLNHLRQGLQHSWIGIAAIGLGVLFLIPQTDSDGFRSPRGDERDFVLEAFLLPKQ